MTTDIKSILILAIFQLSICSWLCAEVTSSALLESSMKRLDGIDHEMRVDIATTKSKDKTEHKKFNLSIHWELDNNPYKMIFIEEKNGKKNSLKAWAHHHNNDKISKWVLLPKSGKVKDVTGKKTSEKLDMSEVSVSPKMIKQESKIAGEETINGVKCHRIEVKGEDGLIKVWVDSTDFMVHKKEYYNKKSKLFKTVKFSEIIDDDGIKYYKKASIYDLKKKSKIDISVEGISKKTFEDVGIFNPPSQK